MRRIKWFAFGLIVALLSIWQFRFHGAPPQVILFPPVESEFPTEELDQLITLDVQDESVESVLQRLAEQLDLTLEIKPALANNTYITVPRTFRLHNVRVRVALNLLVDDAHCSYRFIGRRLVLDDDLPDFNSITNFQSRLYSLARLRNKAAQVSANDLADLIYEIRSYSWKEDGGEGEIKILPEMLLVCHEPQVHEQIEFLFRQLAAFDNSAFDAQTTRLSLHDEIVSPHLQKRLNEPCYLKFKEASLKEVVTTVGDIFQIPIWIDGAYRFGDDPFPSQRITAEANGQQLGNFLHTTFSAHGIHCFTSGEILRIKIARADEDIKVARLYPISDLTAWLNGESSQLVDIIQRVTGNPTPGWASDGRVGKAKIVADGLWVSQTSEVHDEVAEFLVQLRRCVFPHRYPLDSPSRSPSDSVKKIIAPIVLNEPEQTVAGFFQSLANKHGINISLAEPLQETGHLQRKLPSFEDQGMLHQVVDRCLLHVGLQLTLDDNEQVIAVLERSAPLLLQRCLSIKRFVNGHGPSAATRLANCLTSVVDQSSWSEGRGRGELVPIGDVLVVYNRLPNVCDVVNLLNHWPIHGPESVELPRIHLRSGSVQPLVAYDARKVLRAWQATQLRREQKNAAWYQVPDSQYRIFRPRVTARLETLESLLAELIQVALSDFGEKTDDNQETEQPSVGCFDGWLLVCADDAIQAEVPNLLQRLQNQATQPPAADVVSSYAQKFQSMELSDDSNENSLRHYDLRPLQEKDSTISEEDVAALLQSTGEVAEILISNDVKGPRCFPGMLSIYASHHKHAHFSKLMNYLLTNAPDGQLALKWSQSRDARRFEKQSLTLEEETIVTQMRRDLFSPDPLRAMLAFSILINERVRDDDVASDLLKKLNEISRDEDDRQLEQLLEALSRHPPKAGQVSQHVGELLAKKHLDRHSTLVSCLKSLGAMAAVAMGKMLELQAKEQPYGTFIFSSELIALGESAQDAVPSILLAISFIPTDSVMQAKDQRSWIKTMDGAIEVLRAIDPTESNWRRTLKEWLASDSLESQQRARDVATKLQPYFPNVPDFGAKNEKRESTESSPDSSHSQRGLFNAED